jgi:chitodextrinase
MEQQGNEAAVNSLKKIGCTMKKMFLVIGSMKKDCMVKKMLRSSFPVIIMSLVMCSVVFFASVDVVKAADTTVSINPVSQTVVAGSTLNITILCVPEQAVKAFELKVSFNPSLLQANVVSEGDFFDGFTTFFNPGDIDNTAGTIVNIYDLIVGPGNVTGSGSFVSINFTARSFNGVSTLGLYDVLVTNESAYVEVSVSSGSVTVTGGSTPPPSEPPSNPPSSDENTPPFPPQQPVGGTLVEVGTEYNYSSAAYDPDGDFVRLRFDWGDGLVSNWSAFVASNTSVYASHAWMNVSNHTLRVIAQDPDGENSSWSDPLMVNVSQMESEGNLPVGVFTVPENASSNQTIVFDTSGLYDPDGEIVSYQWDFGDGTTGFGENPVHTYQFPGTYTVTLTMIDDAGLTVTMSQVVSIVAGAAAPTEAENNFFQSNSGVIVLIVVVIPLLVLLVVFRDRIEQLYVQNRIESSRRRLSQVSGDIFKTDQIIDKLFREVNLITPTPSKETILNAYSDIVVAKVEENPTSRLPELSIEEIEKLVDRRIQSKIEAAILIKNNARVAVFI